MILGFDVSKHDLVGILIDKRGKIKNNWVIENKKQKINEFLCEIVSKHPHIVIGSEATNEYHNVLAKLCLSMNIPFYLLNPIVTKQFTRATVRKKKTDLTDAHIIAKCILQGEGSLIDNSIFDSNKFVLRTISRLTRLSVTLNQMKRRFNEHYPEVDNIQEEIDKMYLSVKQGIKVLQDKMVKETDNELIKLLCSIPGIGKTLSCVFIAEIGDVNRFKSVKSLVAYAGLDPKISQSGLTLRRNTRLTKRGSPYLRRAAYLSASIAQRHDIELKEYYLKKRGEGKRYKEATVANARHILARIYAVMKRRTPYVKREVLQIKSCFPQVEVLT